MELGIWGKVIHCWQANKISFGDVMQYAIVPPAIFTNIKWNSKIIKWFQTDNSAVTDILMEF